jgi:hypothetical protein
MASRARHSVDTEAFVDRGFVRVPAAVPADLARDIRAWATSSVDAPTGAPWSLTQVSVYDLPLLIETLTPRLRAAVDRLVGPQRWHFAAIWGFPTRLPGSLDPCWHIDGDWFTHHLTSGEQALTPIFLWQDVDEHDSPTLLCPGSHRAVARLIAAHEPRGIPGPEIRAVVDTGIPIESTVPATGEAGDVILCHPFLAHTINPASPRRARYLSNVAVHARGPLIVERSAPTRSPVELSIGQAFEA